MTQTQKTHRLAVAAMLTAVAAVLQFVEFAIPLMPSFIKLDISDLPALLGTFSLGPVYGVAIQLAKNLLHLPFGSSAGVGELSNFLLGAVFAFIAGIVYKKHKNRGGALWGSCGGVVCAAGPAGGSVAFLAAAPVLFSIRSAWAPALISWMPKPASVRAWLSASFWAAFTKSRLSWVVCWAVLILNGSASLRSRNTLASKIAICSVIRSAVRRIRPLGWAMRNQSFW